MDIRKRKNPVVTTIAIFQLVFGILGLFCGVIALSGVAQALTANQPAAPGQPSQAEIQKMIEEEIPYQKVEEKIEGGVGLLVSILMVVSGIGLLQMKPWGRTVTIVYALISIAVRIVSVLYAVVFVLPGMNAVADKLAVKIGNNGSAFASLMKVSVIGGIILAVAFIIYPIVVLVVMNRASVKAAFSGIPEDDLDLPRDFDERREPGNSGDDRFQGGGGDRFQS